MKTSGSKQIAERYVKALFEVAATPSMRDAIETDLEALNLGLQASADLRNLISNPLLSREEMAKCMGILLEDTPAQKITRQFIALLARQKRLTLLPEIIRLYGQWATAARGEMKAEIVSATPLKPQDISAAAERLTKAYGKKVVVSTSENPELLGGMIVKIGSVQLDSSLNGKMRRLKNSLQAA